jgi:hypothetical protein
MLKRNLGLLICMIARLAHLLPLLLLLLLLLLLMMVVGSILLRRYRTGAR